MDKRKKTVYPRLYYTAAVLVAAVAAAAYLGYRRSAQAEQRLEAHTKTWFESPRTMTMLMTERYGPPKLAPGIATWHQKGPWKRIIIHGGSPDNYLEQVVSYWAPPKAVAPLLEFGHGVRVDREKEELSVTSSAESLNFLALNLAHDVAVEERSPKDARVLYTRTARLAASGRSSRYMEKLLFEPYRPVPQERQGAWSREVGY